MSSLLGGDSPSLGGSKWGFLLAFLSVTIIISIDTGHLPHLLLCIYTLATKIHQGNQLLTTARGVIDTSPVTCFCTYVLPVYAAVEKFAYIIRHSNILSLLLCMENLNAWLWAV